MKRQTRTEGSIVEIPLGNDRRAFGRLLYEPLVEFYEIHGHGSGPVEVDEVTAARVTFTIPVMNSAVTSGRWRKIGKKPLTETERRRVTRFCLEDLLTGRLSLFWTDAESGTTHQVPATREECLAHEAAAVWSAEHVEDRLRDHFAGRTNVWLESLRPGEP